MKKIIFVAILFLLYSCKCKNLSCPAFNSDYLSYLNFNINDTLKYVDSSGNMIKFIVTEKNLSSAYTEQCTRNGFGGCVCGCGTNGHIIAISDSSRVGNNILKISINTSQNPNDNSYPESKVLDFQVFNFRGAFAIANVGYSSFQKDSLIPSITLGSNTYTNVHFQQYPTNTVNLNSIINVYYNQQYGILGFYDNQTHSFFYRQ